MTPGTYDGPRPSGSRRRTRSPSRLGALVLLLSAGVLHGEVPETVLVLPGVAHASGFDGTLWRTRLVLFNAGSVPAQVRIEALRRGRDNSDPASVSVSVGSGEATVVDDVLQTLFGLSGAAALRLSTATGVLAASGHTADVSGEGSVGQLIEAFGADAAVLPGEVAYLPHLSQSVSPEVGHRTAIGFVNLEGGTAAIDVEIYRGDGTLLGAETFLLQPYEYRQIERIILGIAGTGVEDGVALLRAGRPASPFIAYAAVVDNRSADPFFVPARTPDEPAGVERATVTLPGGVLLDLVRVPPGAFLMGSPPDERGRRENEGPRHEVTLTHEYFIGCREVTQAQWKAVLGSLPPGVDEEHGDRPVHSVSWDAVAGPGGFLDRLNAYLAATGQDAAGAFRLPTEAEWERAARAGTATRFSFGDALACDDDCGPCSLADRFGWWCGNQAIGPPGVKPGSRKQANALGIHDLHGNVWEWVDDVYSAYSSEPQTDPIAEGPGALRVFRGGDSDSSLALCRSAARGGFPPDYSGTNIGFRLAR